MRCPLCQSRPARRRCPALDQDICPVCCGTKRRTEIRCPDTCAYLANAETHPPVAVRRQQEQDLQVLLPGLRGLSEPQQQLFFLSVTLVARSAGGSLALDAATDADVADAARALAGTYETAAKGLIYEQQAGTFPARRLADELRKVYEELGRTRPAAFAVDAAHVLRGLASCVAEAHRTGLDARQGFLDVAARVAGRFGPTDSPSQDAPASSLILP